MLLTLMWKYCAGEGMTELVQRHTRKEQQHHQHAIAARHQWPCRAILIDKAP